MLRNRRSHGGKIYESLSQTSATLFDAYQSNSGKIVEGILHGALGGTVAAMSSVADDEMLGIHAALGGIWVAMTAKNYVEAGHQYLNKKEEDLENLGVEIMTFAKMNSQQLDLENPEQSQFNLQTNQKIAKTLSSSLEKLNAAPLNEAEIEEISAALSSAKNFETFASKKTELANSAILLSAAAIGVAGVGFGVGAIALAGSNSAAFNGGIAAAGIGAGVTSIAGGLLNAGATNSKSISSAMLAAVTQLNEREFADQIDQLNETREEIRKSAIKEKSSQQPPTSVSSAQGNPMVEMATTLAR